MKLAHKIYEQEILFVGLRKSKIKSDLDNIWNLLLRKSTKTNRCDDEIDLQDKSKANLKINPVLLFDPNPLNGVEDLNAYFIERNNKLSVGELYACCFYPIYNRKNAVFEKYPLLIAKIVYFLDIIWHRVFPKLFFFDKVYALFRKNKRKYYPSVEILGRLCFNGFRIISEKHIDGKQYIIVQKIKEASTKRTPRNGLLIKLKRIGKNGKEVNIYKLRTMHAYSECLQEYVYEKNNLDRGGKFANDFRIPKWGRILRKYWLDELPMIFNLLKGDVKLVGVRPLSRHYFNLYREDLQELRCKTKPGLLPPYYADMPETLDEIQASEEKYLNKYLKNPISTDLKYLFLILNNIVLKSRRSK